MLILNFSSKCIWTSSCDVFYYLLKVCACGCIYTPCMLELLGNILVTFIFQSPLLIYQFKSDIWKLAIPLFLEDGSILQEMTQAFASRGNSSLGLEGRSYKQCLLLAQSTYDGISRPFLCGIGLLLVSEVKPAQHAILVPLKQK